MEQPENNPSVAEEFNPGEPVYLVENSERQNVDTHLMHNPHIPVVKVAYIRTSRSATWNRIRKYSAYKQLSGRGNEGKYMVTPYVVDSTHDFVEL